MNTQEFGQFLRTHGSIFRGLKEEDKIQIKHEIQTGFLHGLSAEDISIYAKAGLSPLHMQSLRIAMEEGVPLDFIKEHMLDEKRTNEELLQIKIAYYQNKEAVEGEIPEVYLKALQLELSKLEYQIEQQRTFFKESLLALKEEKEALRKELKEQKRMPQQKESNQVIVKPTVDRKGANSKKLKHFLGLEKKRKDWILSILSNPDFSIAQLQILKIAYERGIDKKTIYKLANPAIEESKMELLLHMLAAPISSQGWEVGEKGGEDSCPQAEGKK